MFQESIASAPGKCIFTGEHAVVYEAAAVVIALELHATTKVKLRADSKFTINLKDYNIHETLSLKTQVKPRHLHTIPIWQIVSNYYHTYGLSNGLDIEIRSEIPKGVGLGSSAAVAVATAAAINNLFELNMPPDQISQQAYEAEKITHVHPSGIDNTIAAFGGAILYKKGKITRIEIPFEIPLLLINSGVAHETKTQVTHVRNLYETHPSIFGAIFQAIDAISLKVENALRIKNLEILGDLLNYNQHLLRLLGVSSKELEQIIDFINLHGAIGAKLTGAGGGGCVLALFESETSKKECINQLRLMNIECFNTKISEYGVKIIHTSK